MKHRQSSRVEQYDIRNTDLFKPESWTPETIDATMEIFEGILDAQNIEPCMEALLSAPAILHLFISAASDQLYASLRGLLLDQFPTLCQGFEDSISWKFVSILSLSLVFLTYPSEADTPIQLSACRRCVELAGPALTALSSLQFLENTPEEETSFDFQTNRFVKVRPKSQRQQKKAKQALKLQVDPTPFNLLGVPLPTTPQLAEKMVADILHDLKELLQYYLNILRRPSMYQFLKTNGLMPGAPSEPEPAAAGNVQAIIEHTDENTEEAQPSAYPMIQPMKAALYFESAKGLGDWHILISTRANADIREARRKDSKTFRIIIKKIKELSNGHFSDDNQKRLTGPNLEVPVYEAKMSRDLRLVYQIDCIPEFDSDVERQVIKIFGVYTHAQMDNRLWNYVGHQLSRKGREYRRRCAFRNQPLVTGDNVITPASFPSQEIKQETVEEPQYRIPCEYLQEIHSLLVLEKFVTMSQALLNSIMADKDVAHVFAVSPQEREVIEHPSSCYVIGRSGTGKTTTMLFKMLGIQRTWELNGTSLPKPRQIFVTRSRVLAGRVEEYFSKLMKSLAMASQTSRQLLELPDSDAADQEKPLVDPDEDDEWRSDLPKRFSLLEDEHFPLFLSFDQLCRMLEEDLGSSVPFDDQVTRRRSAITGHNSKSPVTYEIFLESYWPHLPTFLTKGLDPALVFSEIMGVIKGSEHTLHRTTPCLDRQSYISLSHRCHSTFASQRDRVYKLFETYQKRRKERGQMDTVDRTHKLLQCLRQTDMLLGHQIDFLYVDEVQDNHLIDAYLLRSLCKNPHGLFWAGDSAQTISVGSSFRFDDLKAFLYRIEALCAEPAGQIQPRTFQLTTNYRSHGGIVRCAHSIVKLLTCFWPYSIDALDEEKGVVDGLKPVFFGSWARDTLRYEQFLFGDSKSRIEFGARQCILVRSEAARNALREQVGEIGLILTLYESKGLEFDDVLLYKFFEDSALDLSQWRLLLNGIRARRGTRINAPSFDEIKHAGVCSELKFLYVAITRARNNLWIFDPSPKAEPMKVLWSSHDLIEIYSSDMHLPQLAVTSTPEEWSKSGRSLFENKRYFQAMHCFKRAGKAREAAVAHAFYLRDQARSTTPDNISQRLTAFVTAAEAFIHVAEAAGKDATKRAYYKIAANCYLQGDDEKSAAQAFLDAKEYTSAAQEYRQVGMFNEAVAIIHNYPVEKQAHSKIIHAARLFYLQRKNFEVAAKLFKTMDEGLEFMDIYGFDDARANLLEKMGRHTEAAELHLSEGRVADAIRMFLKEPENEHAARRAKQCLVDCLWQNFSFSRAREDEDFVAIPTKTLLKWAMQIDPAIVRRTNRDEIYMFKMILNGDHAKLQQLGQRLYADNDKASALLCFNHAFVSPTHIRTSSAEEVAQILQHFLIFVQLLRDFALEVDPIGSPVIKRLFGFHTPTKQAVFLPEGTFLNRACSRSKALVMRSDDKGSLVSNSDFLRLYKRSLADHLRRVITPEDDLCREAKAFQPCLPFIAFEQCKAGSSCSRDHVDPRQLSIDYYNVRVRLHLQQILILQTSHFTCLDPEAEARQRYWLTQLYEALHPMHPLLGSLPDLELWRIPEAERGLQVTKHWLKSYFYSSRPPDTRVLQFANLLATANLGFSVDAPAAREYILRSPYIASFRPNSEDSREHYSSLIYLLRFLRDSDEYSLSAGVFFVRIVFQARIPLDINVLCNLTERLCGSLVLYRNHQRSGTLHGLRLPGSWLLDLSGSLEKLTDKDTSHLSTFVKVMAEFLGECAANRRSMLCFEGRSLSKHGMPIQAFFIARICRCICLLGDNLLDWNVRDYIHRTITSMRRLNPQLISLCNRYVNACSWSDLAVAARHYPTLNATALDTVIQLHDLKKDDVVPKGIFDVRRVPFRAVKDIPYLITVGLHTKKVQSQQASGNVDISGNEPSMPLLRDDIEPDHIEENANEDIGIDAGVSPLAHSEEQAKAARIIQTTFRRFQQRRRSKSQSGLHMTRVLLWEECYKNSGNNSAVDRRYRHLYLGPLVHILACLECIHVSVSSCKEKAKKKWKEAQHQELEDASELLTKINKLLRDVLTLQKLLQPYSSFHQARDSSALAAQVLSIEGLVEQMRLLPSNNIHEFQQDLALGLKGFAKPKYAQKKLRPTLYLDSAGEDDYS